MATIGGKDNFGLFTNGDFRDGTVGQFNFGTFSVAESFDGLGCVTVTGGGGSTYLGSQFLEVDTSKTYQMIAYLKTITRGSTNNDLAGGHIGFSCYDVNKTFVDLRNCKGIGDTTLTRDATPGDTSIYVADASGWSTSTSNSQRGFMLFGGDYPYADGYSRYTDTSNFYPYDTGLTNLGGGEWRIDLTDTLPTWTNALVGGVYPTGTYVANGRSGGTYNYALSNPNYPEGTWTRYATPPFTGESRNSSYPFRYGTKYIKFMILRNYNNRTDSPQDHEWAIDRIFFGQCLHGRDYRDSL